MHIISGQYGGQSISSPKKQRTHPMSDKMRGGLFNVLGDIDGLDVLDVYSGSGALAIEAISRGANSATAIEADNHASKVIKANIAKFNLENKIRVTTAFFASWSNNSNSTFDLVFADPPYDQINVNHLNKLNKHLRTNGTLVLSLPAKEDPIELQGLKIVKLKNYGDSQLVFYRKVS